MEVCIELNEWKTAIELARDHGQVADVSGLLAKYARQFIEKDNILSAVELYRYALLYLVVSIFHSFIIDAFLFGISALRIK